MLKWDERFLAIARQVASWSKDPHTKVGAVLVKNRAILRTGYNGLPHGVSDNVPDRHERPEKYQWYEHAERNALCNVDATDGVLYCTLFPCADCARGIVQSGVRRVVIDPDAESRPHWEESFKRSSEMMQEAGIEIVNCPSSANG